MTRKELLASPPTRQELLAILAKEGSIRATAAAIGVSFPTVKRWLGDANPRLGIVGRVTSDGPLSAECRRRCVEEFLRDYPDPLALLSRTQPKLLRTARKLGVTREELVADCQYAAVLASRKYDPARKTKFATLVTYSIWSVVKATVTARQRRLRERPLSEED